MALSLNLSMRRLCHQALRAKPVAVSIPPPHQIVSRRLVQHQHPSCLRQTVKQLCDHHHHRHLQLDALARSRVDVHVSRRNFFTKWRSSLSRATEKSSDGEVSGDKRMKERLEVGEEEEDDIIPKTDENGQPLTNWARMKIMMKAYGYVIIPVHWLIAPVWFGTFYYTIKLGVDIAPLLKALSVSEHHIEYLQNSKASTALLAYALYKVFTPLRYTVTLGATEVTIRKLRRMGYIKPKPPKEKSYSDSFKETVTEMKDKVKDIRDQKNT